MCKTVSRRENAVKPMLGLEFSLLDVSRPASLGRRPVTDDWRLATVMLRFLKITYLAVIDAAEAEFASGLNVLTGETGAGKSILVEAVGLLLGGRASADLVRMGEESATIEAIFETGGDERLVR